MKGQLEYVAHQVSNFLPSLLGALLVLLAGWLLAHAVKMLIVKLLRRTTWDERVFGNSNLGDTNVFLANIFYYIILIIVMLIVLEILGINQVLRPLENMLGEFLSFIPNLIGAALIAFIGYILAKFVANLINIGGNLLDKLAARTSFKDTGKLVTILRKVVFIIIFIPFLIQAFNALELRAISEPANDILYNFTAMIGNILLAAAVLILFVWGGKYLCEFLKDLFKSIGIDRFGERIEVATIIGEKQYLSSIAANLIYFFIVFFGVITAVEILELYQLTETLNQILEVTGQIIFGILILAIGNYISLMLYNVMNRAENNRFVAKVARYASLALFLAISLRTMGIANEIVELAFGLILGAIAVAVALSYGLGGREAAGEHFKEIIDKIKGDDAPTTKRTPRKKRAKSKETKKDEEDKPDDLGFPEDPRLDL